MYNKSLKGALENSNGLQNTDEPVNIIKKKKKKKSWGRKAAKIHFILHLCISGPAKWSYAILESHMNPE